MKKEKRQHRERRQTSNDGIFLVEGASAVGEYLQHRPHVIRELLYKSGQERVLESMISNRGDLSHIPKMLADKDAASPIAARIQLSMKSFDRLLSELHEVSKPGLILALDHVQDPRNLGAIVRSAAFFGVKQVVVPNRRQVLLSQAAVATAQGGFALVDLVECVNLARAIDDMKKQGYWALGADMNGESVASLRDFYEHVVVVLGAEDKGLSSLVQKKCDRSISIPGVENGLESLNVSVAAGILLSHLVGR